MWASYVDSFDEGEIVRSPVKFNLDAIPPGSTITSATLYLKMIIAVDPADADRMETTYQVTEPWDEYPTTWNKGPWFGIAGGRL